MRVVDARYFPPHRSSPRDSVERWACSAGGCTLHRVIPWIVIAVVAVPLVVVGFLAMRRNTTASERPASTDASARERTEQEFAEAEAYEAQWHQEDKEKFHQERLP